LKGIVGYSPHEVRFLGLAVPLVTTLDTLESAKAVLSMMRSSAFDPTTIPTIRELKHLLASLDARCYKCGFADLIVDSQGLLRDKALPHALRAQREQYTQAEAFLDSAPSPEMLCSLVDTFRQLARMGESSVIGATIKVGSAAAWIIAFITWTLGAPPSIHTDDGQILHQETHSQVTTLVPISREGLKRGMEIQIHHSIGNPTQPPGPPSTRLWSGMASVEYYGEWLLRNQGLDGDNRRMLHEALTYAIPQVLFQLELADLSSLGQPSWLQQQYSSANNVLGPRRIRPLPGIGRIMDVYSQMLGTRGQPHLAFLEGGMLITNLPLVGGYVKTLKERCTCSKCHPPPLGNCHGTECPQGCSRPKGALESPQNDGTSMENSRHLNWKSMTWKIG